MIWNAAHRTKQMKQNSKQKKDNSWKKIHRLMYVQMCAFTPKKKDW